MKDRLKVSLVQFAPAWLEGAKNADRMREYVAREAEAGAGLVVFPETSNSGHITPCLPGDPLAFTGGTGLSQLYQRYAETSELIPGPLTGLLASAASEYGVYIIAGILESHPVIPTALFNSAVLIGPQGSVSVQRKLHTTVDEQILFSKGDSLQVYATDLGNIGLIVGHDAWLPEVSRVLALGGAEIVCHVCHGSDAIDEETTRDLAAVRARESTVYFLVNSCAGGKGTLARSAVASPMGTIVASADSGQETVVRAELTHEELVMARGRFGVFRDRRPELYTTVCQPTAPESGIIRKG